MFQLDESRCRSGQGRLGIQAAVGSSRGSQQTSLGGERLQDKVLKLSNALGNNCIRLAQERPAEEPEKIEAAYLSLLLEQIFQGSRVDTALVQLAREFLLLPEERTFGVRIAQDDVKLVILLRQRHQLLPQLSFTGLRLC